MDKATRRAHIERLKKNRQHWWGRKLTPVEVAQVVNTPTPCSCHMCGNPRRRHKKLPIQDRRKLQDLE